MLETSQFATLSPHQYFLLYGIPLNKVMLSILKYLYVGIFISHTAQNHPVGLVTIVFLYLGVCQNGQQIAVLKIAHFKEQLIFALLKAHYMHISILRQKYYASNLLCNVRNIACCGATLLQEKGAYSVVLLFHIVPFHSSPFW